MSNNITTIRKNINKKYKRRFLQGRTFISHYENGLCQDTVKMRDFSKRIVKNFLKKLKENEYPILVYSGMSGISLAISFSTVLSEKKILHGMCYIRKTNENSHGSDIELNISIFKNKIPIMVFVDDLIELGSTRRRCIKQYKSIFGVEEIIEVIYEDRPHVRRNDYSRYK